MPDLDDAIRAEIGHAVQQIKGCDPDTFTAMAADELSAALFAALDLHKPFLAEPTGDPDYTSYQCMGCAPVEDWESVHYPCPTVLAIAEKLGVEVPH
jgi:hypothetical protein